MDVIQNATTTVSGTITIYQSDVFYSTSSPVYQYYANGAALMWLTFLILATASFFTLCYFFYKRINR